MQSRIVTGGLLMLNQQKNQNAFYYANYWLSQSSTVVGLDQQKIGLQLLNYANVKFGSVPANQYL